MSRESIAFGISGIFFGIVIGWIVGSQSPGSSARPPQAAAQAPAPVAAPAAAAPATGAVIDEAQVGRLEAAAEASPRDEALRVQLGNVYFDAERYADAIRWYQAALTINPKDANVSTDLGVSYYYSNQVDKALQQFAHSLSIDPGHTKTLLNQGIVLIQGRQDVAAAMASWQKVIDVAPDSEEGRRARQLIDAHPAPGKS